MFQKIEKGQISGKGKKFNYHLITTETIVLNRDLDLGFNMSYDLARVAEQLYNKTIKDRVKIGDEDVTLMVTTASYLTLLSLVMDRGLSSDPRVNQAIEISKMADDRDIKSTPAKENTFDYSKAVYLLTRVLYDNLQNTH